MDLANKYVWVALLTTLGFGIIGWVDDYKKIVHKNPKGLIARWKYFWQSVIGLAVAASSKIEGLRLLIVVIGLLVIAGIIDVLGWIKSISKEK